MKKWILAGIIGLLVIFFIVSKGGKGSGTVEKPITIGASLALTGNLAFIGTAAQNGMLLATEEINAKAGSRDKKIELIIEDNAGDAKNAASSVQKLIGVNDVDLVFTTFTHIAKAVISITESAEKPLLYASTDGTIAAQSNFAIRDYFDAEQSGVVVAHTAKNLGYADKNIKLISEVNDACKLFNATFASESGRPFAAEEFFQPTDQDLRSQITKLNLGEDDLLVACAFRHSHILMRQLNELGLINIPTLQVVAPFLPSATTPEIKELFSKNKTVSTWYGIAEEGNTATQEEFIEKYIARFNQAPAPDALYAYDDMYILYEAIPKCLVDEELDNSCFLEEMKKVNYSGVSGKISFDEKRRSTRDVLIIRASDGVWSNITNEVK